MLTVGLVSKYKLQCGSGLNTSKNPNTHFFSIPSIANMLFVQIKAPSLNCPFAYIISVFWIALYPFLLVQILQIPRFGYKVTFTIKIYLK